MKTETAKRLNDIRPSEKRENVYGSIWYTNTHVLSRAENCTLPQPPRITTNASTGKIQGRDVNFTCRIPFAD
jgi:hypothetical protein